MRKFQIPVRRLGAGYVVVVWSQSHPEECQNRIDKLKKRFGLEFLNDGEDISEPVKMSATAEMVPDYDEQMDMYAQMAESDE
jgi:ribosome assembly protein YihI (activator of Der GTPase)